jgi:hypothetical protein
MASSDSAGQPLTRDACEKASMKWDDNNNVCGGGQGVIPAPAPAAAAPVPMPEKAKTPDAAAKAAKPEKKKKKIKRAVKKKLKKGEELNKRERRFILRRLFKKPAAKPGEQKAPAAKAPAAKKAQ